MKRAALLWLAFALTVLLLPGCHQDKTWQRVQETGVLRVGLDPSYPPFAVYDGSNLWGFDVDLSRAVAAELGVTAEFVHFGYDGLYDALLTGQVDVLISALVIDVGRTRDFAYSRPYFNAGEILIVPESETDVAEMADMNGRAVAVELGAQGHVVALEWQRRLPDLTVVPYNSPEEALTAVGNSTASNGAANNGAADAVLIDAISGRLFLANTPNLRRVPEPITVEPFAAVVRIEDEQLLAALDNALDTLDTSGQLDAITTHWLSP